MTTSALLLIPARYGSERFPGKPLAEIAGRSMIQRVYEQCQEAVEIAKTSSLDLLTVVVTDDKRIEDHVSGFGGRVCRVDDDVSSGSERIKLAFQNFFEDRAWDFLVNVQGDEPLIEPESLVRLIKAHDKYNYDIMTMVKPQVGNLADFKDPNRVKVVYSELNGQCFYFSRAPIPHPRDQEASFEWALHIGVYSYRPTALEKFCLAKNSRLECLEKLEQLRALEIGLTLGAVEIEDELIGVDTPEDITKVEGVLSGRK
jgi:3-deoxy-manno-octulosonate cytidylyltransferase (CMP-KDO synthetase)